MRDWKLNTDIGTSLSEQLKILTNKSMYRHRIPDEWRNSTIIWNREFNSHFVKLKLFSKFAQAQNENTF